MVRVLVMRLETMVQIHIGRKYGEIFSFYCVMTYYV